MSFLNNGITGHRGDPQHFPQNTIAGFESAIKMGCDWVETDMHFTGDGKIILSHDGNTNQQGDIRREIAKTEFEELRKINIANFFISHVFVDDISQSFCPCLRSKCQ